MTTKSLHSTFKLEVSSRASAVTASFNERQKKKYANEKKLIKYLLNSKLFHSHQTMCHTKRLMNDENFTEGLEFN